MTYYFQMDIVIYENIPQILEKNLFYINDLFLQVTELRFLTL